MEKRLLISFDIERKTDYTAVYINLQEIPEKNHKFSVHPNINAWKSSHSLNPPKTQPLNLNPHLLLTINCGRVVSFIKNSFDILNEDQLIMSIEEEGKLHCCVCIPASNSIKEPKIFVHPNINAWKSSHPHNPAKTQTAT
jgi:hypothetical protein